MLGRFRRMIGAAGGGAGIAAVFRAPIGGFLYALEELLLQGARPVVMLLFGHRALVALAAELYCRYVEGQNRLRLQLQIPLAADFINRAGIRQAIAEGNVDIGQALAIFLVLFFSTGLAAAAGTPGGLFAPMLTLGGALGLAAADLVEQWGPDAPNTAVFAGMGAFMAACARTPISATFLTFAISKDLLILKPVLEACLGSLVTARLLHRQSLFKRLIPSEPDGVAPSGRTDNFTLPSVPLRPRPLPRPERASVPSDPPA
ncbi:chloride channel protein [Synechococcus sp. CS-1328]|uniref:chloride channel protein n=1 Tax=Synechococcus sp. CS-1328 TaxID=2847976 RepID=UPI0037DA067A